MKPNRVIAVLLSAALITLALAACGSSSKSSSTSAQSSTTKGGSASLGPAIGAAGSGPVTKTAGPSGEPAVQATSVGITPAEIAELKAHHFTAAMAWHESGTFTQGVTSGADAEFKRRSGSRSSPRPRPTST